MKKYLEQFGAIFVSILITMVSALLTGLLIMWLWNWLMPIIFAIPSITYIQGWGISFLSGMLFRSTIKVNRCKSN